MPTFPGRDGTTLHELVWAPTGTPRGAVVLAHGYGEHIGRYDETGRALAAAGWHVRGIDFRGHGQSGGVRGFCTRFSDFLDDLDVELARARETPGPLFLVAHSFGGLVATRYAFGGAHGLTGLVLSSPYYRLKLAVSPIKIAAARLFSSLVPKLALPIGLKGSDVAHDPSLAALYETDPLNNKNATARWFTETTQTQADVLARAAEVTLPVLLLHGAADRVADPQGSADVFARLGSADKTLRMLDGQYHEILNEPPEARQKTVRDIAGWLEAHVPAGNVARA